MNRRAFIALLGGAAAAWPGVARARQTNQRRTGHCVAIQESAGAACDGLFLGRVRSCRVQRALRRSNQ